MSSSKEDFKKDSYWKKAYLATARQLDNFRSNYINATTKLTYRKLANSLWPV